MQKITKINLISRFKAKNIVYRVFDEATDIRGWSILNILIGEYGNSEDKVYLIAVLELEKTNAVIINQRFFRL